VSPKYGKVIIISHKLFKGIDLKSKKTDIDANFMSIKENQDKTKESRKVLGKETKDFKLLSDEDKISGITKLLKSYQIEIDNLTRRSL
jgi:homeobox protein cut-like